MAVDRGGLQYTIAVRDQFSEAVASFTSSIRAAKDEFAAFRAEVSQGRGAAASVRDLARAAERASRSTARSAAQQEAALRRAAASARQLQTELRAVERRRGAAAAAESIAQQRAIQAERQRLRAFQQTERARERESRRILAALRRDEAAFQREQLRRLQELAGRRAAVERQRLQQLRAARAEQAALDRRDPVRQGTTRAEDAIRRRAAAVAEVAELRRLGREDLITKQLQRQAGELRASARSANSLLFTFRRLVGVLAAFQLARAAVGAFRDLITTGIRFNDQIRQAEIGIAGLITGLADVRDEQGRSVGLSEEYARALGEARRQTELLRQDALLTTATFEQLLDTFQIAIGPGFAAGLNLDQIRALSVSISQAATAIGLPQNQLAEEIRSLLSGTIQARTTRIATALQITNADIRRLRATGELFDFLEDRFRALGLAAEQAARQTLSGIGQLVRDAGQVLLGRAAQPLFEELIRLGNEVFDQVLTIRDAAGNVRPNPEAVAAFRSFFEALREGVEQARELARELGFEGLQNIVGTLGRGLNATLQAAIGFAGSLFRAFDAIVALIDGLLTPVRALGISLGDSSRFAGRLLADFVLLRAAARLFGLELKGAFTKAGIEKIGSSLKTFIATPLGRAGLVGAAVAAIGKGFELWLESIFKVNLGLRETLVLLQLGLSDAIDSGVTAFDKGLVVIAGKIKEAFTDDEGDAAVRERVRLLLQGLDDERAARVREFVSEIERIVAAARGEAAPGPVDRPADPNADTDAFAANVSNVESIVAQANGTIGELEDRLREVSAEFRAAGGLTGAQGFAGEVERAFAEAAASVEVEGRRVQEGLNEIRRNIAEGIGTLGIEPARADAIRRAAALGAGRAQDREIEALRLTEQEGRLLSLLRDELRVQEVLTELKAGAAQNAALEAAVRARELVPQLQRELAGVREQAIAEGAIAAAVTSRLGARRLEAIEARNALEAFRVEAAERRRAIEEDLAAARAQALPRSGIETAEARALDLERRRAAQDLVVELEKRLGVEVAIAEAQEMQLEFAEEQARLAAEGSFVGGVRAGLQQLADDLPNLFDAARNIVQGIVNSFISAAGEAFRAIVDPRVLEQAELSLSEFLQNLVGELLLDIAQQIFEQVLQSLIQNLISSALTEQAAAASAAAIRAASANSLIIASQIELANARLAAAVRAGSGGVSAGGGVDGGLVGPGGVGLASGGPVPRVPVRPIPATHARARGMRRGGRPRGLDPRDTVPAFLQPGEFVVRKAVVDDLGVGFFKAVNSGRFRGPPPAAPAAGAGFQGGGFVQRPPPQRAPRGGSPAVQVLPVQVTTPREMDRLQAGQRSAFFQMLREDRGTIRGILNI